MKTIKLLLVWAVVAVSNQAFAQNTTAKIETLPKDKKTNCYIRYYYYPNLEAYFDNLTLVYHYKEKGEWKTAPELPPNYGGYSMYNKAHVIINDYDDDKPYELLKIHKKLYPYNSKGRFTTRTTASSE
ncbi:hypothetical protein [Flavobacterium sedimenticola]|uniref:Uncharacterized protein n=1 Tax=Flavobacterium sedimenticola TaxID=3043286 RepID=A0ABT6XTN1_9FLAO|nr:hypothetical protein [Flavobacterium sedimenticola]MDI9258378.1 hypothetical protein [Flavobacterium sedimenticola]